MSRSSATDGSPPRCTKRWTSSKSGALGKTTESARKDAARVTPSMPFSRVVSIRLERERRPSREEETVAALLQEQRRVFPKRLLVEGIGLLPADCEGRRPGD